MIRQLIPRSEVYFASIRLTLDEALADAEQHEMKYVCTVTDWVHVHVPALGWIGVGSAHDVLEPEQLELPNMNPPEPKPANPLTEAEAKALREQNTFLQHALDHANEALTRAVKEKLIAVNGKIEAASIAKDLRKQLDTSRERAHLFESKHHTALDERNFAQADLREAKQHLSEAKQDLALAHRDLNTSKNEASLYRRRIKELMDQASASSAADRLDAVVKELNAKGIGFPYRAERAVEDVVGIVHDLFQDLESAKQKLSNLRAQRDALSRAKDEALGDVQGKDAIFTSLCCQMYDAGFRISDGLERTAKPSIRLANYVQAAVETVKGQFEALQREMGEAQTLRQQVAGLSKSQEIAIAQKDSYKAKLDQAYVDLANVENLTKKVCNRLYDAGMRTKRPAGSKYGLFDVLSDYVDDVLNTIMMQKEIIQQNPENRLRERLEQLLAETKG